jgi:hypothetical protein
VTYMKPGQPVFHIRGGTRGGWFQATSQLKETLVSAGLPENASAGSNNSNRTTVLAFAGALIALLIVSALLLRRRVRPAVRMARSTS